MLYHLIIMTISQAPFDLVHFDIWVPSPNTSMDGSQYFVIFVDDFSRCRGFIFSEIDLNCHKFTINLLPWFVHNFLLQSRYSNQIMYKNLRRRIF